MECSTCHGVYGPDHRLALRMGSGFALFGIQLRRFVWTVAFFLHSFPRNWRWQTDTDLYGKKRVTVRFVERTTAARKIEASRMKKTDFQVKEDMVVNAMVGWQSAAKLNRSPNLVDFSGSVIPRYTFDNEFVSFR